MRPLLKKWFRNVQLWKINKIRKKVVNENISIICNNCIAGIIYHDLNLRFNTPTINLFICAPDYCEFLENLAYYLDQTITFSYDSKYVGACTYPIGILGKKIEIHFLHYASPEEANKTWSDRAKRIYWESLFIIGSDRDFCTMAEKNRFNELDFPNKIFFTSIQYKSGSFIWFKNYFKKPHVGDLIKDGKAWYFFFDVALWFNEGKIRRTFFWEYFYYLSYCIGIVEN